MKNKYAQKLASMRKLVLHTCPQCKKDFEGIKQAIYCSNACKQAAKYQRNKGK